MITEGECEEGHEQRLTGSWETKRLELVTYWR